MQNHRPSHSSWSDATPASSSPCQQYWLQRPGALTAGLRKLGHVDLRIVTEQEETLTPAESWMLQRPDATALWVREIVMAIDGVDCVFGRSFTPLAASQGLWSGMRQLQTRPLADMLYNDPEITRSSFYNCVLSDSDPMTHSVRRVIEPHVHTDPLMARASVFWRRGEPLLVAECFLPHFWDIAQTGV